MCIFTVYKFFALVFPFVINTKRETRTSARVCSATIGSGGNGASTTAHVPGSSYRTKTV